jgi:hypothetical protein
MEENEPITLGIKHLLMLMVIRADLVIDAEQF